MKITKKDLSLLRCLRENSRMSLTEMSRKTGIAISTLHDRLRLQKNNIHVKHTTLVDFDKLGFPTRAQIFLKAPLESRLRLQDYLAIHSQVNNVFKSNNKYDFIIEGVFSEVSELDFFLEDLERRFSGLSYDSHLIVKDVLREGFFNKPA